MLAAVNHWMLAGLARCLPLHCYWTFVVLVCNGRQLQIPGNCFWVERNWYIWVSLNELIKGSTWCSRWYHIDWPDTAGSPKWWHCSCLPCLSSACQGFPWTHCGAYSLAEVSLSSPSEHAMLGANIRIAGPKGAWTRTVVNSQHVAKHWLHRAPICNSKPVAPQAVLVKTGWWENETKVIHVWKGHVGWRGHLIGWSKKVWGESKQSTICMFAIFKEQMNFFKVCGFGEVIGIHWLISWYTHNMIVLLENTRKQKGITGGSGSLEDAQKKRWLFPSLFYLLLAAMRWAASSHHAVPCHSPESHLRT